MTPSHNDIGAFISVRRAIPPQAAAAGAISGDSNTGIDRSGFQSCVLHVGTGATSGTPDSFSVAGKLQESDSAATGYTDITDAAITSITTENSAAKVNVDLSGCKQYIRAVVTPAFVNGSTPKVGVEAVIVLGGSANLPTT